LPLWLHGLLISLSYQGLPTLLLGGLGVWWMPEAGGAAGFVGVLLGAGVANYGLARWLTCRPGRCPGCRVLAMQAETTERLLQYRCQSCRREQKTGYVLRRRFHNEWRR
jgi:hypothetical protein